MNEQEWSVDAFDEDKSEDDVIEREYSKAQDKIEKEGYREGLEHGHGTTIQHGFNKAYKYTTNITSQIGEIKGKINAVLSIAHLKPETLAAGAKDKLENLLSEVAKYEEKLKEQLKEVNTAKTIVQDAFDTVPNPDQTSSMYVEDDLSDFLGLKSDASSDSESVFSMDAPIAMIDDMPSGSSVKRIKLTENKLGDSQKRFLSSGSSGDQRQLNILSNEIEEEISKFNSDFMKLQPDKVI